MTHSHHDAGTDAVAPIVIISPVRNEEALLPNTIASMTAQSVRPAEWILVDDGSTDRTAELVREAALDHDWIRLAGALHVALHGARGRQLCGAG